MSASGQRPGGARLERMRASPRFSDGVFRNSAPVAAGLRKGTTLSTMGQFFFGGQRRTPPAPLPSLQPLDIWARPPSSGLRATWLGHSTVLVEIDGARILTDPVWGERASPARFAGPKRFQPVPVPVAKLPPLDAVIISHDHYDHLDYPTILELVPLGVPFFTSLGVGAHLESWGVPPERITELDWWERAELPGRDIAITAAPSQHFSGRGPVPRLLRGAGDRRRVSGRNTTAWSSFVVAGAQHKFFFSGDTGLTPEYGEVRERLGPFDLVMLEVGAYHPAWGDIHLGPDNALEALRLLGGGAFLPVHWGTFNLAIHAWDQPAERLLEVAPAQGVHLLMPRLGEALEPAHGSRAHPWWRAVVAEPNRHHDSDEKHDGEAPTAEAPLLEPID